ncbi:hypothetical protein Ancab_007348 [Ancistrocladus abbreviatus]
MCRNRQARILKSEASEVDTPAVVSFTSCGPNSLVPEILKHPGVEILAAYSPVAPVTQSPLDKRFANYIMLSGTSMSRPHAAGTAAYVKSIHLDWFPLAIKSALMTTDNTIMALSPVKAADPGLVYESMKAEYVQFSCNIRYSQEKIEKLLGENATCPESIGEKSSPKDLNYPSMAVFVPPSMPLKVKFCRTVTNVGSANSKYEAKVVTISEINFTATPNALPFNSLKERKSFCVTVEGKALDARMIVSASLLWSDGSHDVRSPIVVYACRSHIGI